MSILFMADADLLREFTELGTAMRYGRNSVAKVSRYYALLNEINKRGISS